jgi:hypothetical protein
MFLFGGGSSKSKNKEDSKKARES